MNALTSTIAVSMAGDQKGARGSSMGPLGKIVVAITRAPPLAHRHDLPNVPFALRDDPLAPFRKRSDLFEIIDANLNKDDVWVEGEKMRLDACEHLLRRLRADAAIDDLEAGGHRVLVPHLRA
jgi:hypothetical protein